MENNDEFFNLDLSFDEHHLITMIREFDIIETVMDFVDDFLFSDEEFIDDSEYDEYLDDNIYKEK